MKFIGLAGRALPCLVIAACAPDSAVATRTSFDGTITAVFVVSGVFGGPDDYTLTVDQDPLNVDVNNPCADKASVHLTTTTRIVWSDALEVQVSPTELVGGRKVRVEPPDPAGSGCSRRIEATYIVIVR